MAPIVATVLRRHCDIDGTHTVSCNLQGLPWAYMMSGWQMVARLASLDLLARIMGRGPVQWTIETTVRNCREPECPHCHGPNQQTVGF